MAGLAGCSGGGGGGGGGDGDSGDGGSGDGGSGDGGSGDGGSGDGGSGDGGSGDGDSGDGGSSDYPNQRIRLIIPFSEGGGTDTWHRNFIPHVSDELGVPIQIDNIPGAASLRGAAEMVRAEGDGYTLGAFNPPSTPTSYMLADPDWDITTLKGVCRYARQGYVTYGNPSAMEEMGIEDYNGMLEAYQNGDVTNFGGQQVGGIVHVMSVLLKNLDEYNLAWENYIGYDGGGPLVQAVASGEVPFGVTTPSSGIGAIENGNVEVLAVMASEGDPVVPDTPSVTDLGYPNIDYIGQLQRCQWAPEGTPDDHIDTWASAMESALQTDEFQNWLDETGNRTSFAGPEAANSALQNALEQVPANVDLQAIREQMNQ
jgi:tripartite-type tricarboxylate transporter receptor subunit TctC